MATQPGPLTPPSIPYVDQTGRPSDAFRQYINTLDQQVRGAQPAPSPPPTGGGGLSYWNGSSWTTLPGNTSGFAVLQETAAGVPSWVSTIPTIQRFTSGTAQTYTAPAGLVKIRVRMTAGGGGGGAQATNACGNGGDTSFGTWTCIHGNGAPAAGANANGGLGGTGGVNGTGTLIERVDGQRGHPVQGGSAS